MDAKEKKCKGINKAYGFEGCGNLSLFRTYGLCPKCISEFRKTFKPKPILKVSKTGYRSTGLDDLTANATKAEIVYFLAYIDDKRND